MARRGLTVDIRGDTSHFERAMMSVKANANSLGGILRGVSSIGVGLAAGLAAGAVAAGAITIKLASIAEGAKTADARLGQVAKSMGSFGENTQDVTKRLVEFANTTARQVGIDQNAIKLTQAKLLTFKDLAKSADKLGGNFDRATMAALNMEAAGFGSAEQAAVQLGKALQDPIKGVTALARSGITFTEQEKEKLKTLTETNRILEAQDMILSAIEMQVGGVAVATANATDRLRVAWSQVLEKIGGPFSEMMDGIADSFDAGMDQMISAAETASDALGASFRSAGVFIGTAITDSVAGDSERLKAIGGLIGAYINAGMEATVGIAASSIGNKLTEWLGIALGSAAGVPSDERITRKPFPSAIDIGASSLSTNHPDIAEALKAIRALQPIEQMGPPASAMLRAIDTSIKEQTRSSGRVEDLLTKILSKPLVQN